VVAALLAVVPLETPESERTGSLEKAEPEEVESAEVVAEERHLPQLDSVVPPLRLPAPLPRPASPNLWTSDPRSPLPPAPPQAPARAPPRGGKADCLLWGAARWNLPADETSVSMSLAVAWLLEVPGWLELIWEWGARRRLPNGRCESLGVPARATFDGGPAWGRCPKP